MKQNFDNRSDLNLDFCQALAWATKGVDPLRGAQKVHHTRARSQINLHI